MSDGTRPLSSNSIGLGILLAALAVSLPLLLIAKEGGAFDDARSSPMVAMAMGVLATIAVALAFGMPLALKRLRDPRLGYGKWAATGALGGSIGAILLNLMIVVAALSGPGPIAPGDYSLGVAVVAIFVLSSLAGAAIAALARVIAIQLHDRNRG